MQTQQKSAGFVQLEFLEKNAGMARRLLKGAARMALNLRAGVVTGSTTELRPMQVDVYTDFVEYLEGIVHKVTSGESNSAPMSRIILPPRTGKTVAAAAIIAGTGLMATIIVPTQALVEQIRLKITQQLPHIAVGAYYGNDKDMVLFGANVTTYTILEQEWASKGYLPAPIALSALVFCDEGHHAMTPKRLVMLEGGFDPLAPRVALTATPNYDERRALERFFPHLVHQITLVEAVELEILAPLRVKVDEVDVDASQVHITGGDYDEATLGRLMDEAPFFKPALDFRYAPENAGKSALFCCLTRQQAYDLHKYLLSHRPAGTRPPELILGDTDPDKRQRILENFDNGRVDTLVNVGVLLEGWDSERCKILIDLAPSISRVRAMQKFFRPMTKWGDAEAWIYMLLPKWLPVMPLLPMDFFGIENGDYGQGELIASGRKKAGDEVPRLMRHGKTPIGEVEAKKREIYQGHFKRPTLDPVDLGQVRDVLRSNRAFRQRRLPSFYKFRKLFFHHELFAGRGEHLIRYCGGQVSKFGYLLFMAPLFPEKVSNMVFAGQDDGVSNPLSCYADAARLEHAMIDGGRFHLSISQGWAALAGAGDREPIPSPEEFSEHRELVREVHKVLKKLTPREERVIKMRFGIGREGGYLEAEQTLDEVSNVLGLDRATISYIEHRALRKLRRPKISKTLAGCL